MYEYHYIALASSTIVGETYDASKDDDNSEDSDSAVCTAYFDDSYTSIISEVRHIIFFCKF